LKVLLYLIFHSDDRFKGLRCLLTDEPAKETR
jgi:hypothetical protein